MIPGEFHDAWGAGRPMVPVHSKPLVGIDFDGGYTEKTRRAPKAETALTVSGESINSVQVGRLPA